jgi:hypothetical protein
MAKSETVSTAKTPDDLDKAYASALKALSVLGLKMATKKPDPAKLSPAMVKTKKPAEFKLVADGRIVKLTVECPGMMNTLGLLDVQAERDVEKRIVIMKSLVEAGLLDKAQLDKEVGSQAPDPKVIANLTRELADVEKKIADAGKLLPFWEALQVDQAMKIAAVFKELKDQTVKEHNSENIDFLEAVAAKKSREAIIEEFLDTTATRQVNLPAKILNAILAGGPFAPAEFEIKKLIQSEPLKRLKDAKKTQINAIIAELNKKKTNLEALKKKVGVK